MVASHPSAGNQRGPGGTAVTCSQTECWSWVLTHCQHFMPGAQLSHGSHFVKNCYIFHYLVLASAGSSLLPGFLSRCDEWGHLFIAVWILLLQGIDSRAHRLSSHSSRALGHKRRIVEHGLSCSVACGIFPDQGWKPCFLRWQSDSLPPLPPGKPLAHCVDEKTGPQK